MVGCWGEEEDYCTDYLNGVAAAASTGCSNKPWPAAVLDFDPVIVEEAGAASCLAEDPDHSLWVVEAG